MKYRKTSNEEGAGSTRRTQGIAPVGIYDVEIIDCIDRISKAGNPMIEIKMAIKGGKHDGTWLWEYIVESASWKLEQFWGSIGYTCPEDGDDIDASDFIGREGRIELKHERRQNGQLGVKVKKWLAEDEEATPKKKGNQHWAKKRAIEKNTPAPEPAEDDLDEGEVPF